MMKKNVIIINKDPLGKIYEEACFENDFSESPYQKELLSSLQALYQRLETPSFFTQLFKRPSLKGLYIWGEVGRGKTFLMDLFYHQLAEKLWEKVTQNQQEPALADGC